MQHTGTKGELPAKQSAQETSADAAVDDLTLNNHLNTAQ